MRRNTVARRPSRLACFVAKAVSPRIPIRLGICKFDPDGRMVARLFPTSSLAVDFGSDQSVGQRRTEQEVVDAKSGIAREGVSEILPEGVYALVWVERPQSVGPTVIDQAAISLTDFRSEQSVVAPSLWSVDIDIGRHDVVVAHKSRRNLSLQKFGGMGLEALEPLQLVIELRAGTGLPLGR